MLVKGNFYNTLIATRGDSEGLQNKMEETVQKFLENETGMNKPGMLLGKIQGGKTRAFIGIIALAFDNDYDMAIILTKGRLYQTIWDMMERHIGLEITKPPLFIITIKNDIYYEI